jgi:hypothetical protein
MAPQPLHSLRDHAAADVLKPGQLERRRNGIARVGGMVGGAGYRCAAHPGDRA